MFDVHVYFYFCDVGFSSSSINFFYQMYVTSRTALLECVVCELLIKGNHVDLHPFRISAVKRVNDLPVVFLCFVASGVGCVRSYYM